MNKLRLAALTLLTLAADRAAYAQPTASRLVAITNYSGTMSQLLQTDSIYYKYPSGYTNSVIATNSFEWYGGKETPRINTFQSYDANGNLVAREFHLWNNGTRSWDKSVKLFFTIDAKGRVTQQTDLGWNASAAAYKDSSGVFYYTLDAAGNQTAELRRYWDSPSKRWRDAIRWDRTFNAQGSLLTETTQSNSAGTWKNSTQHKYTYDAGGRNMLSDTTLAPDAVNIGTWRRFGFHVYALNASGKPYGSTEFAFNTATAAFDSVEQHNYQYDAAGNLTRQVTHIKYTGQAFRNYFQDDYTYNSFNQQVKYTRNFWGTSAYDYLSGYQLHYYGSYIPASVPNGPAAAPALTLSPNPASDAVEIRVADGGAFTALIVDMQGRVHQKFSGNSAGGFAEQISLSAMPAGTYAVKITTAGGGRSAQLLTVRH